MQIHVYVMKNPKIMCKYASTQENKTLGKRTVLLCPIDSGMLYFYSHFILRFLKIYPKFISDPLDKQMYCSFSKCSYSFCRFLSSFNSFSQFIIIHKIRVNFDTIIKHGIKLSPIKYPILSHSLPSSLLILPSSIPQIILLFVYNCFNLCFTDIHKGQSHSGIFTCAYRNVCSD